MADASYDAVIIGGGHHATIIACYLQDAGMETAIFERQHELGGGACNDEVPLPGFIGSTCAHFTRFYSHPAYDDFKLSEMGVSYITPEQGAGMIFDDETCLLTYPMWRVADIATGKSEFWPENAEKTFNEVARFSQRDAETARVLTERYQRKWREAYALHFWNPPQPWGKKDPMEELFDDPRNGIDPVYQVMTVKEMAYDLFESREMRTFFIKAFAPTTGCFAEDVPGVANFMLVIGLVLTWLPPSIVIGGVHNITHALQRAYSGMGGEFFVHHEVDKVLIENGRAKGVRLVNGTQIEAKKIVISTLDAGQLIFRLLGEEHSNTQIRKRVKNINYDRGNDLWGPVAMYELPKYRAASFNSDCGLQPRCFWGPKDPDYLAERHKNQVFSRGIAEKMYIATAPDSIWDKTRAPEGVHNIQVDEPTAPARYFSERQWLQIKRDFVGELIKQWQWYAPNMTEDNIIGAFFTTPYETMMRNINMPEGSWTGGAMIASQMGRFRPTPELANYRTPIENLYHCSGSTHFGCGIGRSGSYNCYKVIAEDLGLRKVWEEKGRPY